MEFFFEKSLPDGVIKEAQDFYDSLPSVSIEQHPEWEETARAGRSRYFFARKNGGMVCFARIEETRFRSVNLAARIDFGPLFKDAPDLIESIKEIHGYYKRKGFLYLAIQLITPSGETADYVESGLKAPLKIRHIAGRGNKTSLVIDLGLPEDKIFGDFSKGHKSAIKRAAREGLTVSEAVTAHDAETFAGIYIKMLRSRRLAVDAARATEQFRNIFNFLKDKSKGRFVLVKDAAGKMLGGIIAVSQGNTVRYYKGAADPDKREIPVLHLAFWEAIKAAKGAGFKYFDLWGYNPYVGKNDQVYRINIFKKGFGGNLLTYPKVMHMDLKPFGRIVFNILKNIRRFVRI